MSTFDFNPYEATYTGLANLLRASLLARSLIVEKNFIRLDEKPVAYKEVLAAADFPDLVFTQEDFGGSPYDENSNNRDTVLRQTYCLKMTEASMFVTRINDLKLACLAALVKAGPRLGIKTPQGEPFIDSWRITQGSGPRLHPNGHAILTAFAVQVQFRIATGWLQEL